MRRVVKRSFDLGGVVAQEIDRLAHLGDGVGQGLARFAHEQAEQAWPALLQQVGGALQAGGALRRWRTPPDWRGAGGAAHGQLDLRRRGRTHPADLIAQIRRIPHRLPAVGAGWVDRRGAGAGRIERHGAGRTAQRGARHAGRGGVNRLRAAQQTGNQRGQLLLVRQIQARRVQPRLRAQIGKQVTRQRDVRMRRAELAGFQRQLLRLLHRVRDQFDDRHAGVAQAVDKRGVGAVFEQAAHQVGQQRFVRADRGVNAARAAQFAVGDAAGDLPVQRLAHAVQALEFVLAAVVIAARHLVNRGDGLRVVRGELRVNRVGRGQQLARAGEVRHVGVHLAGIDRVALKTALLGALDFAVPVSALDQPDHQPVAAAPRQVDDPVNHRRAALLVRLQHKTDAVPALERRLKAQAFEQIQRQLQPVGLFGIDVQADVIVARQQRQLEQARQQLAHHALALGAAVARVQRRQLDRNARPRVNAAPVRGLADGVDGLLVSGQIPLSIHLGGGGFAQHVVGVAKAGFLQHPAVGQRLGNGLAGDELLAHQRHRVVNALTDQRLATLADQARQRRAQAFFAVGGGELAGQQQTPDGGVDKHRRRMA